MPAETGGREEEAPVFDSGVELDGLLTGGARDQEGVFVGAFEEVGRAEEVPAELRDERLLFGEGVGAVGVVLALRGVGGGVGMRVRDRVDRVWWVWGSTCKFSTLG